MFIQFDAGEGEQVFDQAAHTRGFHAHDAEELFAGRCIIARMAAQGVDEAGDGGERGAQFVAGIGDEIGAHPFGAFDRGEIVQQDHGEGRGGAA